LTRQEFIVPVISAFEQGKEHVDTHAHHEAGDESRRGGDAYSRPIADRDFYHRHHYTDQVGDHWGRRFLVAIDSSGSGEGLLHLGRKGNAGTGGTVTGGELVCHELAQTLVVETGTEGRTTTGNTRHHDNRHRRPRFRGVRQRGLVFELVPRGFFHFRQHLDTLLAI